VSELKAQGSGSVGAFLRKEGLYYSIVYKWAQQQETGHLAGRKTGPKEKSRELLQSELNQLRRKLDQTEKKLKKTELIVELQKKLSSFLELDQAERNAEH
jgi:transposase-like protein